MAPMTQSSPAEEQRSPARDWAGLLRYLRRTTCSATADAAKSIDQALNELRIGPASRAHQP